MAESIYFNNIAATTAPFALRGGVYSFGAVAGLAGTIQLQMLAGDGASWINVGSSITTTSGQTSMSLAPGTYRVSITTATGVYIQLGRVPTAPTES